MPIGIFLLGEHHGVMSTQAVNSASTGSWTPILSEQGCDECRAEQRGQSLTEAGFLQVMLDRHSLEMTNLTDAFSDSVSTFLRAGR